MKYPVFEGAATAIITPLRDGNVDIERLERNLDCQLSAEIAAIVALGTTGESATLTQDEKCAVLETCVQKCSGTGVKVIAGIGGNDTRKCLENALCFASLGADAMLMTTPYYNKTSQKGLVEHFSRVADECPRPVILYNVPSRTGIGIETWTYKELSLHKNIVGVKEASGNMSAVARTIAECGDELVFWSGNDDDTVPMMALGARGVISVASNIVPETVRDICSYCLDGEFYEAASLYGKNARLFASLFCEVNPMPVKKAMELMGLDTGELRLPLVSVSGENTQRLGEILRTSGLI